MNWVFFHTRKMIFLLILLVNLNQELLSLLA